MRDVRGKRHERDFFIPIDFNPSPRACSKIFGFDQGESTFDTSYRINLFLKPFHFYFLSLIFHKVQDISEELKNKIHCRGIFKIPLCRPQ